MGTKADDVLKERGPSAVADGATNAESMPAPATTDGKAEGAAPGRVRGEELALFWRTVGGWQTADGGAEDWFAEAPPKRRWILTLPGREAEGVFPRGKVGMLAAGGGVGKTMALVQLALSVATGRRWLGRAKSRAEGEEPPRDGEAGFMVPDDAAGRVLLALAEEDAAEVRRRFYNAARLMRDTAGLTDTDLHRVRERIVLLPLAGQPVALVDSNPGGYDKPAEVGPSPLAGELARRLSDGGEWSLVILDPLARFAGLDTEKDNASATRFVQILEELAKAPGHPSVLVAHHTTKTARREGTTDDTAARGASAISDGIRWHASLVANDRPAGVPADLPRLLTFEVVKSNYAARPAPLLLTSGRRGELSAATDGELAALEEAQIDAMARAKIAEKTKKDAVEAAVARLKGAPAPTDDAPGTTPPAGDDKPKPKGGPTTTARLLGVL